MIIIQSPLRRSGLSSIFCSERGNASIITHWVRYSRWAIVAIIGLLMGSLAAQEAEPAQQISKVFHVDKAGFPTVIHCDGAQARYIRIQLCSEGWLNLAEVEVFGVPLGDKQAAPANLALGKPAAQSSTADGGLAVAGKANDGNTDGRYEHQSVSHTNLSVNPWWEVDLGQDCIISEVRVWNRSDGLEARLSNFNVMLSSVAWARPQANGGTSTPVTYPDTWGYLRLTVWGGILLVSAWVTHLIWWRRKLPKHQTTALLVVFTSFLLVGLVINGLLNDRLTIIKNHWEMVLFILFYIPVAFMYISLYSLIEENSPSLLLIDYVAKAGKEGRDEKELLAFMCPRSEELLDRRLAILVRDNLIHKTDGLITLSKKGKWWGRILSLGSKIINLPVGK